MALPTHLEVVFSCGHTETKDFSKTPAGKRKSRAFGLGKNFVCSRCFKQQSQKDLAQYNKDVLADAMALEQDYGLPDLTGSEKQVQWATRIRFTILTDILESDQPQEHQTNDVIETSKALTKAGWWIDNFRDISDFDIDDLIELILTGIDTPAEVRLETENPF